MRAGRARSPRAADMKKDVRILLVGERESRAGRGPCAPPRASQPRGAPPEAWALRTLPARGPLLSSGSPGPSRPRAGASGRSFQIATRPRLPYSHPGPRVPWRRL